MTSPGGVEVVVDHVCKSFEEGRITALVDVSLRLEPGDFVSLIGPSGCGKSTLLNLIGALDRPDSGTITVGGRDLASLPDLSRYRAATVGFVFQFHHLIPTLNAVENVQVPMMGRGISRSERERRALGLLEDCAIAHRGLPLPPCPAASASGWLSPGPSPTIRACSWPTSPPAPSTRPPVPRSSSSCCACASSGG